MDGEKEPEEKSAIQLTNFTVNGGTTQTEKDGLQADTPPVTKETARLRIAALGVSVLTVIVLGSLGVFTLVISINDSSSSSFAVALTLLLDCLSSCVVIWRYSSAQDVYSSTKEKVACIALAILFMISGSLAIIKSAFALSSHEQPSTAPEIWYVALANAIACFALCGAKFYLAYKLISVSIRTDGINSLIGGVMALGTLIGDLIYQQNTSIWYIDSVVALVCSPILIAYGSWLLYYELRRNNDMKYQSMD